MPPFLTWESMGQSSTTLQTFTSFENYVVLQFSTIFNHSTFQLFRTFIFLQLVLFDLITFKLFLLFSSKVEQFFNFSTNLTLKPMGGGRSPPPLSVLFFPSIFFSYENHSRFQLFRTFSGRGQTEVGGA